METESSRVLQIRHRYSAHLWLRERHMKPETHNSVFLTADHMLSDPQLRGDTARGVTDALCSGLEGLNAGAGELERQRSKDGFL